MLSPMYCLTLQPFHVQYLKLVVYTDAFGKPFYDYGHSSNMGLNIFLLIKYVNWPPYQGPYIPEPPRIVGRVGPILPPVIIF